MKIGALASSLRLPLLETFDAYRQMGLQGVQIGVNMEFLACPDEKIEEIKARCKMDGLTISAICGDIGVFSVSGFSGPVSIANVTSLSAA